MINAKSFYMSFVLFEPIFPDVFPYLCFALHFPPNLYASVKTTRSHQTDLSCGIKVVFPRSTATGSCSFPAFQALKCFFFPAFLVSHELWSCRRVHRQLNSFFYISSFSHWQSSHLEEASNINRTIYMCVRRSELLPHLPKIMLGVMIYCRPSCLLSEWCWISDCLPLWSSLINACLHRDLTYSHVGPSVHIAVGKKL